MISVMNNEFELERNSDVAADLSFFGVESSEKNRVSGDTLSEPRIDGWNGVFDGEIDGTEGLKTTTGSEETRLSTELYSGESESKSDTRISDGLQLSGGNVGSDVGNVELEKKGSEEVRVSSEIISGEIDRKMEVRALEVGSKDDFAVVDTETEQSTMRAEVARVYSGDTKLDAEVMEEPTVLDFDSSYSLVDEGINTGMYEAFGSEAAAALSYGFEPGDMVWGKVKSHPWWPGQIFNEVFASPSVRRIKREGHVLVAFFGDSSYGWFDPAELIPFELHYAEKSRQTSSRTFTKAVDEAVDEASRRSALGLTCRCRNPFNFRHTNVQGYFAVDVGGYEPGGVYSLKQIKKARESFQSAETLSFVQQLALMPRNSEQRSIDRIKNMATILAYRRAAFDEFDETYAQAFGIQPVRPSCDSMGVLDQPTKVPSRAPLSGPLVIAEALGEKKSSTKPTKFKDQSKKDKYLFKRRDGPNDPRAHQVSLGRHAGFVAPSSFKEGAAAMAPGDYVIQKRTPAVSMKPRVPVKQEAIGINNQGSAALIRGGTGQEAETVDSKLVLTKFNLVDAQVNVSPVDLPAGFAVGFPTIQPVAYGRTPAFQGHPEDGKLHLDKEMGVLHETNEKIKSREALGPKSTGLDVSTVLEKSEAPGSVDSFEHNFQQEGKAMIDSKREEGAKISAMVEGLEQPELRFLMPVEDLRGPDQALEGGDGRNALESLGTPSVPINANLLGGVFGTSTDGVVKKAKVLKRPGEDLNSEKSIMREKKKKKKELGLETSPDHPQKRRKTAKHGESLRKSAGKSIGIGLVPRENTQVDPQRDDGARGTILSSDSAVLLPKVDLGNIEVELPQLVSDLWALALDPFHGVERNSSAIVRQVLLRFRSLVYQKSLILAPPSEADASELCASKSPVAAEIISGEDVGDLPSASRLPKHSTRPDDPTKAGRKRSLSDRQEEMSAKRLKKLNVLKSMAAEKKAGGQKIPEVQQGERKEAGMTVPAKAIKPDSVKKLEPPVRVSEPAMLVMKFPPRTTLPSVPELKARFARFGPLDHSAMRVFWKSSTCRVVFKQKSHAQAAHNYAVRNKALFGHVKVNYHLRDLGVPAPEVPDSAKRRLDDTSDEVPQLRHGGGNDSVGEPRPMAFLQRPQQPTVQLKSILKKPSGEEAGPAMGVPRESPRVKFMLGGEESGRGEQKVGSSSNDNNNTNGSGADGGALSSLGMDINSKNFQKVIPQPLPPLLPLPPPRIPDLHESRGVGHFTIAAPQVHYSEVEPRNNHNYNISTTNTNNSIDISHRMLSLLMRCNDIVTDVKCSLGYIPYHPL